MQPTAFFDKATIKLSGDIPIPTDKKYSSHGEGKYKQNTLEVGQSLFYPVSDRLTRTRIVSCFGTTSRVRGQKFVTRIEYNDGIKGFRVWRTE